MYWDDYGADGNVLVRKPEGIGDVNSTEPGSGARYNAGKPPLSLVPLTLVAEKWAAVGGRTAHSAAMMALGHYQTMGHRAHLHAVMHALDTITADGWRECAAVFDYGRRKYAAWNWAKGMAWSIPLECAARHLLAIHEAGGDLGALDAESKLPHRGHVFCNVVMLLQFEHTYPEGNDLPFGVGVKL